MLLILFEYQLAIARKKIFQLSNLRWLHYIQLYVLYSLPIKLNVYISFK